MESGELEVKICHSEADGQFLSPFIGLDNSVTTGLSDEYSKGVIAAIKEVVEQRSESITGSLLLNCAAQDEFGSSVWAFKRVALYLMTILNLESFECTDDELRAALNRPPITVA
jgi:hypothetical protein